MNQYEIQGTGIRISSLSLGTWAFSGAKIWGGRGRQGSHPHGALCDGARHQPV